MRENITNQQEATDSALCTTGSSASSVSSEFQGPQDLRTSEFPRPVQAEPQHSRGQCKLSPLHTLNTVSSDISNQVDKVSNSSMTNHISIYKAPHWSVCFSAAIKPPEPTSEVQLPPLSRPVRINCCGHRINSGLALFKALIICIP